MTKRVKALVKPDLLIWTRTSAGFSVPEAATRLDIDEERLVAWEKGEDAPSIPQLRKLANLYKRPLAVFFLQEEPTGFQVIRDLRRLPGTGFRHYPPNLQMEIRRASQKRALAQELLEDLGDRPPSFTLSAALNEDPEEIGQRIRQNLGITDDAQFKWRDPDGRSAFNGWRNHIEDAGVLVFQATLFTTEEASGFAIAEDPLPIIVVNRKDSPTRRSFSLLHELAHLALRISGVSDADTDAARPPEDQAIEVFCNQVAAATLVPRRLLLHDDRVIGHGKRSDRWIDSEISDLARTFGVSREMLVRRLLTFDRTTEAFYRAKRAQYAAEQREKQKRLKEKVAESEMRRNMPQEAVSNLGRPLVRMVLGNYYQDRLTLSEVTGYLGIKAKHIAKLEAMAGLR